MSFVDEVIGDAQTSVTSLIGAIAGAAAGRTGDLILRTMAPKGGGSSFGALGVEFAVHAIVGSVFFGIAARIAPETSQNNFFSFLFFASDTPLVRSGAAIGRVLVNGGFAVLTPAKGGEKCHDCKKSGKSCADCA